MTVDLSVTPWLAIAIGMVATAVWSAVMWRTARAKISHQEHRATWATMALGAWLASVGTLASAIGFAVQRGILPELVPQDVWSFVASVGRAALAMAGVIVLTHYRPGKA